VSRTVAHQPRLAVCKRISLQQQRQHPRTGGEGNPFCVYFARFVTFAASRARTLPRGVGGRRQSISAPFVPPLGPPLFSCKRSVDEDFRRVAKG
jgi:hypothetical protein